jgi:hypothetical protein
MTDENFYKTTKALLYGAAFHRCSAYLKENRMGIVVRRTEVAEF